MPSFHHEAHVPFPKDSVWEWHMRPGALQRLTPPWADVSLTSSAPTPRDGGQVNMVISRGLMKVQWVLKHTALEEGVSFRIEQEKGPLGRWVHTHRFTDAEGGCLIENEMEWDPPLGSMANLFTRSAVESELARLCDFRRQRIVNDLTHLGRSSSPRLTVAITGATGFIGSALQSFLTAGGHVVRPMVRRKADPSKGEIAWDPREGKVDTAALEGVDALVHLAGESIAGARWTGQKKRAIWKSRIDGTRGLASALNQLRNPPSVFVTSSAVGYYGDRGNEKLSVESRPGKGFLADLCREWETEAKAASRSGIRVASVRAGLVLSPAGGALGSMLLPFKMGLGGRLGSGRQYVSWIDHDDLVGLYYHVLTTRSIRGPVNGTSPHPVPNAVFTSALGRILSRPTFVPVPGLAVKALFGEMGQALLLDGSRVFPTKLLDSGFTFQFEGLEESLRFQMGRMNPASGDRAGSAA